MTCIDTRWTHFQAPVKFEDALGRIYPVPSEYTVNELKVLIRYKFREGPGFSEVEDGQYELIDGRNRKSIISAGTPVQLLPGQELVMSIVLKSRLMSETSMATEHDRCPIPQCGSRSTTPWPSGGKRW